MPATSPQPKPFWPGFLTALTGLLILGVFAAVGLYFLASTG